ncbi:glycosyltransferase [Erythrobacter crassostreae]|uniref:Glycosyltransferase n=1 Tax=Erythrobacter crassostreae TaxID=2828328 RepID=A0A9X1F0V8_9SPHN|nr:glycosyltransferase family 2 protein [Erythrobacter crassostrea]MBV7258271.1 glycosyltransferase [Erythrobacter crassostrea]
MLNLDKHCTVIIPAFNEEAVIARCLSSLLDTAPPDHKMEVIVAANGCVDSTVQIAAETALDATILDIKKPSKTGAINAANAQANHYPRIYLDADIECSYSVIVALVNALGESGTMAAAPAIRLDTDHSDLLVKAYYRVWLKQPYASSGNGGAGCYALSRTAINEAGEFPDIIGDDIWIHTRFEQAQKRYVSEDKSGNPVFTIVRPPKNVLDLIKVEARKQVGNAEITRLFPSPHGAQLRGTGGISAAFRSGNRLLDIFVFFAIKLSARLLAQVNRLLGRGSAWSRDVSARQP